MNDSPHGAPHRREAAKSHHHPLPETLEEAERLAQRIHRAVSEETAGRVRDLHVEVDPDGVTLRGCCKSFYVKQQAQHAAMAVRTVESLVNRIEVG